MKITLHKRARTTPAIRAMIQQSPKSPRVLAGETGLHENTIRKWKRRAFTHDLSSARHNNPSSFNEREEHLVYCLRADVGLSVRDCLRVLNLHINPMLTESSLRRCCRRLGVDGRLTDKGKDGKPRRGVFDPVAEPGFIHLDVKHLPRLKGQRAYVYVAIDRATRYVYVEILPDLRGQTAAGFLARVIADMEKHKAAVSIILTDNGFEWTDRCAGKVKAKASGNHPVDVLCARQGISHRLTRIRHPWTNGMAERFNRRLSEAIAAKGKIADNSGRNCFASHAERNAYILGFVGNYNRTALKCLNHQSPLQSLHNHATPYTPDRARHYNAPLCDDGFPPARE